MGITAVVALVAALLLPLAEAAAQSPVQPDNRPNGVAGETNGRMRPEALVGVEGDCRAARGAAPSLALMLTAARADGVALRPNECYRPAGAQSAAKNNACGRGNCACAAGSGTSMHGWGEAVDFKDAAGSLGFGSVGYRWLKANAARFGWNHARWAEPGGSACPEAWHWEWSATAGRCTSTPCGPTSSGSWPAPAAGTGASPASAPWPPGAGPRTPGRPVRRRWPGW